MGEVGEGGEGKGGGGTKGAPSQGGSCLPDTRCPTQSHKERRPREGVECILGSH